MLPIPKRHCIVPNAFAYWWELLCSRCEIVYRFNNQIQAVGYHVVDMQDLSSLFLRRSEGRDPHLGHHIILVMLALDTHILTIVRLHLL